MVKASLVTENLPLIQLANITCFHGHSEQCPVIQLQLEYGGREHLVPIAKVTTLHYTFLLGRDAPHFWDLIRRLLSLEESLAETEARRPEEPVPSISTDVSSSVSLSEVSALLTDFLFREAQQGDVNLQGLQNLVAIREGQVLDA